jgi:transposase
MPVKLGFKNFYLYSAVELGTGEHFTLEISHVNTTCLNVFLQELSKNYPKEKILLVIDGAGWHKSKKLEIPHNIEIIYLPPYSPELNPVERLWAYVKSWTIRNKVYTTLSALQKVVADFINALSQELVGSLCSINYLYN